MLKLRVYRGDEVRELSVSTDIVQDDQLSEVFAAGFRAYGGSVIPEIPIGDETPNQTAFRTGLQVAAFMSGLQVAAQIRLMN